MKKGTKILSLAAALTLGVSTVAFAGCGEDKGYKGEETLAEYQAAMTVNGGEVSSNGGFVVEKGGYVYFINGVESTTADNGYGTPVKGSLMRIAKSDLESGKYDQAKIVIPSLFTAQDFTAGLYIFGDYVYYATPTTDKNVSGQTGNSYIDFKRAKLDGTEAPMSDYYFRLPSSAVYRFVQVSSVDRNSDGEDDVFCLYEEGTTLKSYNTATREDTVLVKGAADYFYDTKDLTNPNVYYVMSVTYALEQDRTIPADYNQIYCVNAAAQVKDVDANAASYTVADKSGNEVRTYDFDEKAMNKNASARGYDLGDYTTYPYVNLGELVLDGVGYVSEYSHYNEEKKENITTATAKEAQGYTYAIKRYETSGDNVGLYFTRTACVETAEAVTKMFYLEDGEALASGWNTVDGNNSVDIVAHKASDIPDTSIFEIDEENGKRTYTYLYVATESAGSVSNTVINKVTVKQGEKYGDITKKSFPLTFDASGATLWKTNGDYLYYYTNGSKGKNLARINYTSNDRDDYNSIVGGEEYKPTKVPFVEYNNGWYQPEFISVNGKDVLVYANAQNYGTSTSSYNYVYATTLGSTEDLIKANEDYEAYTEYLAEYESGDNADSDVVNLIKYLFGSQLDVTEEAKAEYIAKFNKSNNDEDETEAKEFYQAILDKFDASKEGYIKNVTAYTNCISRMTEDDVEAINEGWDGLLLYPEEDEPVVDEGMATWLIWLIVIGSVIVVAAAVSVPVALHIKKKKAAKREADAIVNSYKRKRIDTTDDKTIDVYADENASENAEEPVEEAAEEVAEEPVEEVADAPAEEATEESEEAPAADAEEEKTE
ncbi:MAG: hypothetical protein IJX31_01850 [Clostridia bacterium]|nr:hypothetical protein [Clostridia bacterium]